MSNLTYNSYFKDNTFDQLDNVNLYRFPLFNWERAERQEQEAQLCLKKKKTKLIKGANSFKF